MMKKLIVFDWNGTLLADTIASWKAANVCLDFYGAPEISLARYRETFDFPVIKFYEANGCAEDYVMSRVEESNPLFQNSYEDLAAGARTRRGTRAILQWIKENQLGCIILSNYRTEKITAHLQRLKIDHYFDHVSAHNCDGSTILQSTSKVQRLSSYMAEHGYKPQDTIIIGDSTEEPDIARELGLISAGITDGYISTAPP